jgi:hypothetical protein
MMATVVAVGPKRWRVSQYNRTGSRSLDRGQWCITYKVMGWTVDLAKRRERKRTQ